MRKEGRGREGKVWERGRGLKRERGRGVSRGRKGEMQGKWHPSQKPPH